MGCGRPVSKLMKLKKAETKKDKVKALKVQLDFRKKSIRTVPL